MSRSFAHWLRVVQCTRSELAFAAHAIVSVTARQRSRPPCSSARGSREDVREDNARTAPHVLARHVKRAALADTDHDDDISLDCLGPNFLAIDPDECTGCGACEPECPANAIKTESDLDAREEDFLALNERKAGQARVSGAMIELQRRGSRSQHGSRSAGASDQTVVWDGSNLI